MPLVPGRHLQRIGALSFSALLFVLASLTTPSLAATASGDTATFTLVAQSNEVIGSGKLSFAISVRANVPSRNLRIEVTLFPKLDNRSEYASTIQNVEPAGSSCLERDRPAAAYEEPRRCRRHQRPLQARGRRRRQRQPVLTAEQAADARARMQPRRVRRGLPDRGRADRQENRRDLAALYDTSRRARLRPSLLPAECRSRDLARLNARARALPAPRRLTKSQISSALRDAGDDRLVSSAAPHRGDLPPAAHRAEGDAPGADAPDLTAAPADRRRDRQRHSIELLGAPFTPVDTSALAAGRSGTIFDQLLNLGEATTSAAFGDDAIDDTYLAPAPLTSQGADLVAAQCADQLILPSGSAPPPANGLSQTAPLSLTQR